MPPLGKTPAFLRDAGRRLERLLEPACPELLQQRVVAGDRARHGRRVHAAVRDALDAQAVGEKLRRPAGGRPTCRGERVELPVSCGPDQREQIAADAGVVLRGDVEDSAGRDGGIDRVAAPPHDLEAGLRGQRIAGRHDTVAREHFRAPLRQPPLRTRTRHRWNDGRRRGLVCGGDAERRRRLRRESEHGRYADCAHYPDTQSRHAALLFVCKTCTEPRKHETAVCSFVISCFRARFLRVLRRVTVESG